MYEIVSLDLEKMPLEQLKSYEKLAQPEDRCYLYRRNPAGKPNIEYLAFAALEKGMPVGLILATILPLSKIAELCSLFIEKPHRRKKLASQLLSVLESRLKALKCPYVGVGFPADEPDSEAIEGFLRSTGWDEAKLHLKRYHFHVPSFAPSWFLKDYNYPKGITEFPWGELRDKEKEIIRHKENLAAFPPSLSPFRDEETIEKMNSLGLRFHETAPVPENQCLENQKSHVEKSHVIGWIVTHRIDPETISYTTFYIHPRYQHLGHSIKMLVNAIRLQQKHPEIPKAIFDLNVSEADASWQRFIARRLAPHASKVTTFKRSWKPLTNS